MKKPSNKATAIYLIWALIHSMLFLFAPHYANVNAKAMFYPFTEKWSEEHNPVFKGYPIIKNFDYKYYDYTEFMVYMIVPILIYYIITLLKTKDEADK
jgi:hypothetical protein